MTKEKAAITAADVLTALDACYPSPPWQAGQIGEAVRWALNGGGGDIREQLEAVRRTAKQIADSVDRALREELP